MDYDELQIEKKRENLEKLMTIGSGEDGFDGQIASSSLERLKLYKEKEKLKFIKKIDNDLPYHLMKQAMKEKWNHDKTMTFFINRNIHITGKITNVVEEGIVEIPLIVKVSKLINNGKTEIKDLVFFGEKIGMDYTKEDMLTSRFYMHRIIVKEGVNQESFMILSENKLNLEEYEIDGMILDLEDFSDISKYAKLMKKNHIIFVNSARPSKIVFKNHSEMFNKIKEFNINRDRFFKYLLSLKIGDKRLYFKHPEYFENLIGSFLLSTKYDSSPYPLHLLIVGKQGGGKSKIEEATFEKMNEIMPIVEGAGSTMKSLIPSFNGSQTKAGALIEANRICFVDEFFRILMRVDKDERENQLTHLNPLLEHKQRRFASGNNYLDSCMTSKLFAVTNPVFGTSNMQMLCNKMDNSFISRILVWFQDEEHYKEVTSKDESQLEMVEDDIDNNLFLSIYDHCNSFKADFDKTKVTKIFESNRVIINESYENVKGVYSSRYKHHIQCLIDGLVKLRCICQHDESFKANDKDYENLEKIWSAMLCGWNQGIKNDRYEHSHNREERFYAN